MVVLDVESATSEMGDVEVVEVVRKEMAMETAFRENRVTVVCRTPSKRQLRKMAIAAAQAAARLEILKYVVRLSANVGCRIKSRRNMLVEDVEAPCKGSKGHKGFREEAPGFCAHFKCSAVGSGRAGGTRCLVARKAGRGV